MSQYQLPRPSEGTWEKLSQVAVKGAEYDSRERQPHPKCLEGTRVDLLKYIHGVLDNREKSQLIWLHGTAGVGKSAVAFTVAKRMKSLKVTELTNVEKRLVGTFFFSRKHTERCTTGYFFATLAYQLACNFPSVREDLNRAIRENPALLDPNKSLRDQMEALFLRPLRKLRFRLRESPPLAFVVDALDECTSEAEVADLISLLGQALRDPDLPVIHILLTSRSKDHIREAIQDEEVHPLVCEIPVRISGEGVAAIISLDGADVDNDIYIFLEYSFRKLRSQNSKFPQPTRDELARLASRAGRRFIVASTMMKFIDDGYHDPRDRLQLMLEFTSELLPGTEVYNLYDRILATCSEPAQAYRYLSIIAALVDPLPISQISELLGPGEGRDIEKVLVQLRSVMDIPTDSSLPVNIYHSSVREYVSEPSNCSLPQVKYTTPPHTLLAQSSFRLMMQDISESATLLSALSELKKHSQAMQGHNPQRLKHSLSFSVEPPQPLQVLLALQWLRGDRSPDLQRWLETPDGRAWLQTLGGHYWMQTQAAEDWLQTKAGKDWLQTQAGHDWLQTKGQEWLPAPSEQEWPHTSSRRDYLRIGQDSLQSTSGQEWLQTLRGREWLQTSSGHEWLETLSGRDWLQTLSGRAWLRIQSGLDWLQTWRGQEWVQTWRGQEWLETWSGYMWLWTKSGKKWLQTESGKDWLQTKSRRDGLRTPRGGDSRLADSRQHWPQSTNGRNGVQTRRGPQRVQTRRGQDWLQTTRGRELLQELLQSSGGRGWLQTERGREWLQTEGGCEWLQTEGGHEWLWTEGGCEWLRTEGGHNWLQAEGRHNWLQTEGGHDWLQTEGGCEWLQTEMGRNWLQTEMGRDWLQTWRGRAWLQSLSGQEWLHTCVEAPGRRGRQTPRGRAWLWTPGGRTWLQTQSGRAWLQTPIGRGWLQSPSGQEWLRTQDGRDWLQTPSGRDWLETPGGRDWLQTQTGRDWRSTLADSVWVTMEEFTDLLDAINKYTVVPELVLLPAFQAIQQYKSLPDFLMFPVFLALRHRDHSTSALPPIHSQPDTQIIPCFEGIYGFCKRSTGTKSISFRRSAVRMPKLGCSSLACSDSVE